MIFADEYREEIRKDRHGIAPGMLFLCLLPIHLPQNNLSNASCFIGLIGQELKKRWNYPTQPERQSQEARAVADKKRADDERAAYQVNY
jgi:hypothetical protein